jgi:epoxyqueuosine reductase
MPGNWPFSFNKMAPRWSRRIPEAVSPVDLDTAASKRVKELSRAAGFQICRITSALPLHAEQARYLHWLADGRQGTMQWMTRERALSSSDPTAVLPAATSVICLGMAYWAGRRRPSDPLMGKIARYAWGADYHAVMGERLEQLASELQFEFGGEHRWYVDTGPMMDKALAARSGLGWYGKNTNILTEQFGSFVLLGEIITTLDLPPDRPLEKGCGACRLCAVACPTGALGPDYAIDANKCISYLTIEHRGVIPIELRAAIGTWVFGCDICQDVCPPTMEPYLQSTGERAEWAKEVRQILAQTPAQMPERAYSEPEETRKPSLSGPLFPDGIRQEYDLTWLLTLTHEQYLEAFRGTAIRRAKVWMLRRNAAVALGNAGGESCVAPLFNAMNRDDHPIVRGHAAWALGRIRSRLGSEAARKALELALSSEIDEQVLREIKAALRPRDNVTAARG